MKRLGRRAGRRAQPRDEGEVVEPHDEFFSNWMCQRCAGLVAAEAEDDDPQMAYSLWCALGGNEYETIDYDEARALRCLACGMGRCHMQATTGVVTVRVMKKVAFVARMSTT